MKLVICVCPSLNQGAAVERLIFLIEIHLKVNIGGCPQHSLALWTSESNCFLVTRA